MPAKVFPYKAVQPSQKISNVMIQNAGWWGSYGVLQVLTYRDQPELGLIAGAFTLETAESTSEKIKRRYVVHISQLRDSPEDMVLKLYPEKETSVEDSVWDPLVEETIPQVVSIELKKNTQCKVVSRKGQGVLEFDMENIPDFLESNSLEQQLDFSSLLALMQHIEPLMSNDEHIPDKTKTETLVNGLFPKDKTKRGKQAPKGVLTDVDVKTRPTIRFTSGTDITVSKIESIHDESMGFVEGPFRLKTPDGEKEYYVHLAINTDGKGYVATRMQAESVDDAWRIQRLRKQTGQYVEDDIVELRVSASGEMKLSMEMLRNGSVITEQKGESWPGSIDMNMKKNARKSANSYSPDWGGILVSLSSIGTSTNDPVRIDVRGLVSHHPVVGGIDSSGMARDFKKIPHWRNFAGRYGLYGLKTPREISRWAWQNRKTTASGMVAAAAVGYTAYTNPEFFGELVEFIPSTDTVSGFIGPVIQFMARQSGICDGAVYEQPQADSLVRPLETSSNGGK